MNLVILKKKKKDHSNDCFNLNVYMFMVPLGDQLNAMCTANTGCYIVVMAVHLFKCCKNGSPVQESLNKSRKTQNETKHTAISKRSSQEALTDQAVTDFEY